MSKVLSMGAFGFATALCSALVPSVCEAKAIVVQDCKAPVVAQPGDHVVVVHDVTCTAANVASWGSASAFITLAPGSRLQLNGRAISLAPSVTAAVTGVQLSGGAQGSVVEGGRGPRGAIRGFARALDLEGNGHVVQRVRVEANALRPVAVGSGSEQAIAAVVIDNGSGNTLREVSLAANYVANGAQAPFVNGLLVWGDLPGATHDNVIEGLDVAANVFAGVEGANPAPLPAPGTAPAAPPGPPIISDPTPDGGGVGQTLTSAVFLVGRVPGANAGNTLRDLSIVGNRVSTQTTTRAALSGLLSFEASDGNTIEGVEISGNDVVANAWGESQAGFVSFTESRANDFGDASIQFSAARAGRAAGGVVVAVGQSNAIHDVELAHNALLAGSFTGGVFLFGELTSPTRITGGNELSDVAVRQNFLKSDIGNAGVFLFSAFANNFRHIDVAENTYLFFGFDVWDFGIFGTTDCSPFAFSPVFVPFPLPPLNYWEDIAAPVVQPACVADAP